MEIPSNLSTSSEYTIQIMSILDTNLIASSNQSFSIIDSITSVNEDLDIIPNEFALFQNYPNPFNPSTTIQYQIPSEQFVSIKVYNSLGQQVSSLVNKIMPVGEHTVHFDAIKKSSGVYLYKIEAGMYSETKKMLLLK